MPQKTSPFIDAKWGWNFGESNWNTGADENWLKFSYLFDSNIDAIVDTLPMPAVSGKAYFLNSDKRVYFVVDGIYYSTPIPRWFQLKLRVDGTLYVYNGTNLVQVPSNSSLQQQINAKQDQIQAGVAGQYYAFDKTFKDLNKTAVGLANVDNTSDINKPVSTQQQAAFDLKSDKLSSNTVVPNLAALKSLNTTRNLYAYRLGYSVAGDDKGTFWRFDSGSNLLANDVTVVSPAVGNGRWLMMTDGWINIKSGGAKVDGVTDDSARVQAVFNAALAIGVGVEFPSGVCLCGSSISLTFSGVQGMAIRGDGSSFSRIRFTSTNGFNFTAGAGNWWLDINNSSGLRITGIAITTTNTNMGIGLNLNFGSLEGRPSKTVILDDVEFRGVSSLNQTWATGTALNNTSYFSAINCRWIMDGTGARLGNGVVIVSTDDTTDPTEIHFTDCVAVYGNIWLQAGNYVEGVYLTNCSAIANNVGVFCNNTTGESGLHIIGGHYSSKTYNFYLNRMNDFTISTALLYSLASAGESMWNIYIDNASRGSITGVTCVGIGQGSEIGVLVTNSNGFGINITGNTFEGMNGNAIRLSSNSSNVVVGPNSYHGLIGGVTPVLDQNITHANNIYNHWKNTGVVALNGGTTFTYTVPVPAGQLAEKPRSATCFCNSGTNLTGYYDYDSSTLTSLVFKIVDNVGGTLPTGNVRFGVTV